MDVSKKYLLKRGRFNRLLYQVAHPSTDRYSYYFNDITSGTNGNCDFYCQTQEGYDYVTGLGSPKAANLLSELLNLESQP